MSKRLLKFRYSPDDGVLVKYERPVKGRGYETLTLESAEKPLQELRDALQAMGKHLVKIAELPDDWKLDIRSLTVTHGDSLGLVITGLRELVHQNAPLCINSPHCTELDAPCREDLAALEELVWKYVSRGARAARAGVHVRRSAEGHAAARAELTAALPQEREVSGMK